MIRDDEAAVHGYIRVIDESGEDYAYTASRFHLIQLSIAVEKGLLSTSQAQDLPFCSSICPTVGAILRS